MKIVVDAMGSDHGPEVVVDGSVQAVRELGVGVVLVGPLERIRPLATRAAGGETQLERLAIELVEAPESVSMEEKPHEAIKRKKHSSILVGLRLLRDGQGDAFVSAGNTGAVMAGATVVLRKLAGVKRAALAARLPSSKGETILLDVGANLTVKPRHLEQFAVMGACLSRTLLGVSEPRVALLSIGEEDVKGNELIRQVHQTLKAGPLNFVGNIDGKALFAGEVEVVVTDGFTGNSILKACESLMRNMYTVVQAELKSSWRARLGFLLLRPLARSLWKRLDHAEYGAVPLVGVSAPVLIGHGSSSARSIRSAIRAAKIFVEARVNEAIETELRARAGKTAGEAPGPTGTVGGQVAAVTRNRDG